MLPPTMIARIEFVWEGKPAVAELRADRRWSCAVPRWREYLNHRIAMLDFSPSEGDVTYVHVLAMARVLGGRPQMRARALLAPGTVY
jgi:hypothetical protein